MLTVAAGAVAFVAVIFCAGHSAGRPSPLAEADLTAGRPQTPADVQAWYVDPGDDKHAAIWYEQGFETLNISGPLVAQLPFFTETRSYASYYCH
jgi:hypothetical protein